MFPSRTKFKFLSLVVLVGPQSAHSFLSPVEYWSHLLLLSTFTYFPCQLPYYFIYSSLIEFFQLYSTFLLFFFTTSAIVTGLRLA